MKYQNRSKITNEARGVISYFGKSKALIVTEKMTSLARVLLQNCVVRASAKLAWLNQRWLGTNNWGRGLQKQQLPVGG